MLLIGSIVLCKVFTKRMLVASHPESKNNKLINAVLKAKSVDEYYELLNEE